MAHAPVQGCSWVNEGKSEQRPKWGWVSNTPGSSIDIKVRSQPQQCVVFVICSNAATAFVNLPQPNVELLFAC